MKRGFYDTVELLINTHFVPNGIDIVDSLRATATYLVREMEQKQKLAFNFNQKQIVKPALKWGQNYTHVSIFVKFAHRMDSPGCLDVWGKNMTLTANRLDFKAYGIQGFYPLEFILSFPLFAAIEPEASFENSESVGTMVIHLKKVEKGIWRYLIPKNAPEVKQYSIKIWWELADQYKSAMKAYNKMIDDEDDQTASISWNAKKADSQQDLEQKKLKRKEKKKKEKGWFSWLNLFN